MKVLSTFYLLFFLFIAHLATAQNKINFEKESYATLLEKAKSQKKIVAIMFYADWCEHCEKMRKEVITDSIVSNYFNKNFINATYEIEAKENKSVVDKFKIIGLPSFQFIDENETVFLIINGELTAKQLFEYGKLAVKSKVLLPQIKKLFIKDVSNSQNALTYISSLNTCGLDATEASSLYFSKVNDADLLSTINWSILSAGKNDLNSREIKYIIQNKEKFVALNKDPKKVDYLLSKTTYETLKPLSDGNDTISYNKSRSLAKEIKSRQVDSLVFSLDLALYKRIKDWKKYELTAHNGTKDFALKNNNLLNDITVNYFYHISNPKGLNEAINWSKVLLTRNPTNGNYITQIKLLEKNKKYDEALQMAKIGKQNAKSLKFSYRDFDVLISEISKLKK